MTVLHRKRQQGMALMLMLWLLLALGALLAGIRLLATEAGSGGRWARSELQAELAAEAGIHKVVMDMSQPTTKHHWQGNGDSQTLEFDSARVHISVQNVKGLVDINVAAPKRIKQLVAACGGNEDLARRWISSREKTPYLLVSQLRGQLGIERHLFACMQPVLTVWSGRQQPDLRFAGERVRKLLHIAGHRSDVVSSSAATQVVVVDSRAQLEDGYKKHIHATVLITRPHGERRPYRILDWQD